MNGNKKKKWLTALGAFVLAFLGLGVGRYATKQVTASAETVTPKYLTYGTTVVNGKETVEGCLTGCFKLYMSGGTQEGEDTLYNNALTNWSEYNITVSATSIWDHVSFTLYRDGEKYQAKELSGKKDTTLYAGALSDGCYEIEYVCVGGPTPFAFLPLEYRYSFEVDTTPPLQNLKAGGAWIGNGGYTNKQVEYTSSDKNFCYMRYMKPTASNYTYRYNTTCTIPATETNNGWWRFYTVDFAGNRSTEMSVYMDTVAPVGEVTTTDGTVLTSGSYTSKGIYYMATDVGGVASYEYRKAGTSSWLSYTVGTQITGTGWYAFRCRDKAGNYSEETRIYYDATKPYGTLYAGGTAKGSGSYVNAEYIKYVASDANSGVDSCYVQMPGSSYFTEYASGLQLTGDGKYRFYCLDKAQMQSNILMIVKDTTKPTGKLYADGYSIKSGSKTNAARIKFTPYDALGIDSAYVKTPTSNGYIKYTAEVSFTAEGEYSFYVVDKAKNQSEIYTVTVDRNIPSAQLYVDDKPLANNGYTNGGHIRFECAETCYVKQPNSDVFTPYVSGMEFYKPGLYSFYGVSAANNSTGIYTVVIDRTKKALTLTNVTNGKTTGDVKLSWKDGNPDVYAPVKRVTVNGKEYTEGEVIYTIDTGAYAVVCEDAAGNVWETEFTSTKQNVLTKTFQKQYFEATDLAGDYYTFSSYGNALAFAISRENMLVRTGTWSNVSWDAGIAMDSVDSVNAANGTYYIYKKSDDPDKEVAYFTRGRLNEVIGQYAKVGIQSYYYWEKEYAPIAEGENLFGYSDGKEILADSIVLGDNIGWSIDGTERIGRQYLGEGRHVLTVNDSWGNTCDYTITVVRRAPDVRYSVGGGTDNGVSFDRTYYFKDYVTLSISDNYDEMAMFSVFDENGELLGNVSLDERFKVEKSGTYQVKAVNHYGESQVFSFVISRNAPSVTMTVDEVGKKLDVRITESVDDESSIQTLALYKSTDDGKTWTEIEKDDYGIPVSLDTLVYRFRTSAKYKVVLTDEFRTGIDAITEEIAYEQTAPKGMLVGVENNGYTNGDVVFTWTDEAVVTLTKDGIPMEYQSGDALTEDGEYFLTFANFDGYKENYAFVIDKRAPTLNLEGVRENGSTNTDVSVAFDVNGVKAILYKDDEEVGEYLSGTAIVESGTYKVIAMDLANNQTEVQFTIDKFVDFTVNVNNGGVANFVVIEASEQVKVDMCKDGKGVEYPLGKMLTISGYYQVKLTDELGNTSDFSFTVIKSKVQAFTFNFDNTPNFEKVLVNGEEKRLNYGTLELFEGGMYEVSVIAGGKGYSFTVTVDCAVPSLELSGVANGGTTTGKVILSAPSERADVKVYLNGTEVSYTPGAAFSSVGKYQVFLTDEVGLTAEYSFEILAVKKNNTGKILGIVCGCLVGLAAVGGLTFVLIKRRRGD